ncbi:MAG: SCO family protein [Sulfuricella sp.]|nr:SCO family protein [Sulfuricella sp.]
MSAPSASALLLCLMAAAGSAMAAPDRIDELARRAGFEQHLNRAIPAELRFRDEAGRSVRLADYLGAAPAVLVFSYYGCANLCPTVIGNLAGRLGAITLPAAENPQVVVVSIDPADSPALAARMKARFIGRPGAARLHLLTGDAASIARLADAAGFRYAYDTATHQYAHPAGIVLLTPQGRIARYLFGFDFTPGQLARALHEAAAQRIASPAERLLLLCFHYDPATGRYSATVLSVLQGLALALLAGLIAMVAVRRGP